MNREETVLRKVDVTERKPEKFGQYNVEFQDGTMTVSHYRPEKKGFDHVYAAFWYEPINLSSVIEEKTEDPTDIEAEAKIQRASMFKEVGYTGEFTSEIIESGLIRMAKYVQSKIAVTPKVEVEPTLREEEIMDISDYWDMAKDNVAHKHSELSWDILVNNLNTVEQLEKIVDKELIPEYQKLLRGSKG